MARYHVTDQAEDELFDIWRYIATESSVDWADRQNGHFHSQFRTLAANPFLGRARPELAPDLRSWPVGSYVVLYLPTNFGVEIARVLHGSRDIESLL